MKEWRETDKKITFCYNEARDNSKFIQAIETSCHALYLDDPVNMKESILGLLQTVRLIYSVSQFYNTSERTSSLMVKVNAIRVDFKLISAINKCRMLLKNVKFTFPSVFGRVPTRNVCFLQRIYTF